MNISKCMSRWIKLALILLGCFWATLGSSQTCLTSSDLDAATRSAIQNAATKYFDMAQKGDAASLQQNAIPSLASSFGGIEAAVKDHQSDFTGALAIPRPPFELKAEGTAPIARAEFLCGVFGSKGQTPNSSIFVIPNLPPGNYAMDVLDVSGSKGQFTAAFVLQQMGTDWKLAGYYVKSPDIGGHNAEWFQTQAMNFKNKGQNHNAWLYLLQARDLSVPVDFMNTMVTDKLYEDAESVKPSDIPMNGEAVDMVLGGKTYKVSSMFPLAVGNDLDLVVKYQVPDVSNTTQVFQENIAVIKGIVAKYPELRDAFQGVVARAVAPSGQDYGTLLPMTEIK
jgi:hypothetical protein